MQISTLWESLDSPNFPEVLAEFLESAGDVDAALPYSGWSLLHYACEHEKEPLIRTLASVGADLDNRADCGFPPIFHALDIDIDGSIQCGHPISFKMTRLLISLGANPVLTDDKNRSLREFASVYGPIVLKEFDRQISPLLAQ